MTTKHLFKKRKAKTQCRKICLSPEKLEGLLREIPPERYDSITIKNIWIKGYKQKLREYNNYTDYNYGNLREVKCQETAGVLRSIPNSPNPFVFSSPSTHEASLTASQSELLKNYALQLKSSLSSLH